MDKKINNFDNFIFDLDGTLLNSDKQISSKNFNTILLLNKLSKNVIIATGRPHYMNKKIFHDLNLSNKVIASNGALIYDIKNDQIVYKNIIDQNVIQEIVSFLSSEKIDFLVYTTKGMIGANFNNPAWFEKIIYPYIHKDNPFAWNYVKLEDVQDLNDFEVFKILVLREKCQDKMHKLSPFLLKYEQYVYPVASQSIVIDIMPLNSDKGRGLEYLDQLGEIDLSRTVAFGDALNDIPMLKKVALPVAMGNAVDEVKKVAKFTTLSNDEDGVAAFIEEMINER